jgi:hypothetical protein
VKRRKKDKKEKGPMIFKTLKTQVRIEDLKWP